MFTLKGLPAFMVTILCTSLLVPAPLQAQTVIYDDFNQDEFHYGLWNIWDFDNVLSQSNGEVHGDGPPHSKYGYMGSKQILRGDLECILSVTDFQSDATLFTGNFPTIWLQITMNNNNFIYINRAMDSQGDMFFSGGKVAGSWLKGVESGAATSFCELKIKRVGWDVSLHYKEAGNWIHHCTFPNTFNGDVYFQVAVYTGDNGTYHSSADWISYSGEAILPAPDIKLNGMDDPLSLPAGANLNVSIGLDANHYAGWNGDYWVILPFGNAYAWWQYGLGWTYSAIPLCGASGPLLSFPSYSVLQTQYMPLGTYSFYFYVDLDMNGSLDPDDELLYDYAKIHIY